MLNEHLICGNYVFSLYYTGIVYVSFKQHSKSIFKLWCYVVTNFIEQNIALFILTTTSLLSPSKLNISSFRIGGKKFSFRNVKTTFICSKQICKTLWAHTSASDHIFRVYILTEKNNVISKMVNLLVFDGCTKVIYIEEKK